jgi:hypothetical protein
VLMPHQSVAHVRSSIVLDRLKESMKLPLKELGHLAPLAGRGRNSR